MIPNDPPHSCETCPHMKEWYHKVPEFLYCELNGEELSPSEQTMVKKKGCLYHPLSRSWLNRDVIRELEMVKAAYNTENIDKIVDEAIALLKNGAGK